MSLLERTVRILNLLADQMLILETMSPLDFVEFRYVLTSTSFKKDDFDLLFRKLKINQNLTITFIKIYPILVTI